jgi:hypothetical protein
MIGLRRLQWSELMQRMQDQRIKKDGEYIKVDLKTSGTTNFNVLTRFSQ